MFSPEDLFYASMESSIWYIFVIRAAIAKTTILNPNLAKLVFAISGESLVNVIKGYKMKKCDTISNILCVLIFLNDMELIWMISYILKKFKKKRG